MSNFNRYRYAIDPQKFMTNLCHWTSGKKKDKRKPARTRSVDIPPPAGWVPISAGRELNVGDMINCLYKSNKGGKWYKAEVKKVGYNDDRGMKFPYGVRYEDETRIYGVQRHTIAVKEVTSKGHKPDSIRIEAESQSNAALYSAQSKPLQPTVQPTVVKRKHSDSYRSEPPPQPEMKQAAPQTTSKVIECPKCNGTGNKPNWFLRVFTLSFAALPRFYNKGCKGGCNGTGYITTRGRRLLDSIKRSHGRELVTLLPILEEINQ